MADSSGVVRRILGLLLFVIVFFSGFLSIALFVVFNDKGGFFENASLVRAEVVDVTDEKYTTRSNDASRRLVKKKHKVVRVRFMASDGQVYEAKKGDGQMTSYEVGDGVDIYYNQGNPSDVRFAKEKSEAPLIQEIRKWVVGVFLVGLSLLFLVKRKKKKEFEF